MAARDKPKRLWRMRRRHDHIDAVLRPRGTEYELQYLRNDKVMVTWRYDDALAARAQAEGRRLELQRAGWNSHW